MDTKELMSGIAVVIDDALVEKPEPGAVQGGRDDLIGQIVVWFETEWNVCFVKRNSLPGESVWPNLLRAASFVLLDWRLWGVGGDTLRHSTIEDIKKFLTSARENLVPVFILTNEDPRDVTTELGDLADDVYDDDRTDTNFVFVGRKSELWSGTAVDVARLRNWVYGNASVYALKTWERVLDGAKAELFQAMCRRSVNWPRVFWGTYRADGAEPSTSLTALINDSLCGRMRSDAFEEEHLGGSDGDVPSGELRRLIAEASFRGNELLPPDEVRCGDMYAGENKKYWLNLRPDCDCVPRNGGSIGEIDVYCVEGKQLTPGKLRKRLVFRNGHFEERVDQSLAFGVIGGDSILFRFGKLRVCKYSEVRDRRVGRLLHPYVTRVQQRYALFMQRQALPRIPDAAVEVASK